MTGAEPGDATVSTLMLRPVLLALETAGIPLETFVAQLELPPTMKIDALADRDGRLPRELAIRMWLAATTATGDDVLGLHLAQRAPVGMYGALEYSIRCCATVGDAFRQLARYYRVVSSLSTLTIESTPDVARIIHNPTAKTPPAVIDNLFAVVVRAGRDLTRTAFLPREVNLTRAAPRTPGEHEKFFGAPVSFSAKVDALVFDVKLLAVPLLTADADLEAAFAKRMDALLDALPSSDRFLRRVRVAVIQSLQAGTGTSLVTLARLLDLSERTLQRRLRENATTHSDVVDQVRRELAISYLADDIGSTEAAYLLGFSEAAAFHRAFKRWTGTTAKEFRSRERRAAVGD